VTIRSDRPAADTLAQQLSKKGYPAYVNGPVPSGGHSIFRIRVGKYKTLKEAEAVKTRLEVEEQFKPWITH
jgi:cell division septation protein DedD